MKFLITIILALIIGASYGQERIVESQNTADVFNPATFQTETSLLSLWLDNIRIIWYDNGGGIFRITASLRTASGAVVTTHSIDRPISVLDLTMQAVSPHTYIRDQLYNAVTAVDPYGLTIWNKLY